MSSRTSKIVYAFAVFAALALMALPASASTAVNVNAQLTVNCGGVSGFTCQTDFGLGFTGPAAFWMNVLTSQSPPYVYPQQWTDSTSTSGFTQGTYSLLPDSLFNQYLTPSSTLDYEPSSTVQSQILTHNSVYTLNTMNSLVNGVPGPGTRTVFMHFFSPVEFNLFSTQFPDDALPACWGLKGDPLANPPIPPNPQARDQQQAFNWSIFASSSLTTMAVGQQQGGNARVNFNVRNGVCELNIFRFFLQWDSVCWERRPNVNGKRVWRATTDSCNPTDLNFGTAHLSGQGGKHGQTQKYGDWRMPFSITLTEQ